MYTHMCVRTRDFSQLLIFSASALPVVATN